MIVSLWLRTALLAMAATTLAALLGLPIGWTLARGKGKGRGLLLGLTLAAALLPTLLTAIGWIAALGAQGWLAHIPLYTPGGVVLVWAWSFWPLLALGAWGGLARAESSLEEAALISLTPWRTTFSVTLPRARPVILASAAVAWILMMGDLGVPGCLSVPVGAEAVHARFSASWSAAGAARMTLPLLVLAMGAALVSWRGFRGMAWSGDAEEARGLEVVSRLAFALAGLVVLIGVAVPALGMTGWAFEGRGFSKAWVLLRREGLTTLWLAVSTGLLATGLGFTLAFALERRPRVLGAAALISALPFALPGTLVGVGLITLWNAGGWRGAVYSSPVILLLAALLRSAAPAVLLAWRGLAALPESYLDAARVCGLSPTRRALSIALPLCQGSLLAGGVVAAVVAAGEVAAATLVSPPGVQTLACRLFSLIHYGADGVVGAVTLMGMAAIVLAGLGMAWASERLRPS